MQKFRNIPQRQCVGCREMKDKKSLIRVVRSPEGEKSRLACRLTGYKIDIKPESWNGGEEEAE